MCKLANIHEKKIIPEKDNNFKNFMARAMRMGIELRETIIDKLKTKTIEMENENQYLKLALEQKTSRLQQLVREN